MDRADSFIIRVLGCATTEEMIALRGTYITDGVTRDIKSPTGHHIKFRGQSEMYPTEREIGDVINTIHL